MLSMFTRRESGVSLIETVVVLAVLGIVAVTFLNGLVISSRAAFTADKQATAGSLAQSQMEWVQNASYNATGYSPAPIPGGKDYINYSVNITANSVNASNHIQKITVTVKHYDKGVTILEGYKLDR